MRKHRVPKISRFPLDFGMDCILILGHSAYISNSSIVIFSVCSFFIVHHSFRFHLPCTLSFGFRSSCYHLLSLYPSYSALFCPTHHDLSFRIVFSSRTINFLISFMVFSFLCAYFLPTYLHSQRSSSLFPPRPCPYYFCFKSVLIICQYSRGYATPSRTVQ